MTQDPVTEDWLPSSGLTPNDKEKTAFSDGQTLWQITVVSSGFCNAPKNFERMMESVLRRHIYETYLVPRSDVIAVGQTFEEELNMRKKLIRFRRSRFKLNA